LAGALVAAAGALVTLPLAGVPEAAGAELAEPVGDAALPPEGSVSVKGVEAFLHVSSNWPNAACRAAST
jgi:hypothetical protein